MADEHEIKRGPFGRPLKEGTPPAAEVPDTNAILAMLAQAQAANQALMAKLSEQTQALTDRVPIPVSPHPYGNANNPNVPVDRESAPPGTPYVSADGRITGKVPWHLQDLIAVEGVTEYTCESEYLSAQGVTVNGINFHLPLGVPVEIPKVIMPHIRDTLARYRAAYSEAGVRASTAAAGSPVSVGTGALRGSVDTNEQSTIPVPAISI